MNDSDSLDFRKVYESVRNILVEARSKTNSFVNFYMVQAYWNIGRLLVGIQNGKELAEYSERLTKNLTKELKQEFGRVFIVANLEIMKRFYLMFQNEYLLRKELTWTHYKLIIKVDDEIKRNFCVDECIKNKWSIRKLEREINKIIEN